MRRINLGRGLRGEVYFSAFSIHTTTSNHLDIPGNTKVLCFVVQQKNLGLQILWPIVLEL